MLIRPVVDDVMTRDVVTVRPETNYKRVVELLAEHRISGLPVVEATGVVVGVVSEADLLHKEEFVPPDDEPQPLLRSRQRKVGEAARILSKRGIKRLLTVFLRADDEIRERRRRAGHQTTES